MNSIELINQFKKEVINRGIENYCSKTLEIKGNIIDNVDKALDFYGENHLMKGFVKYLDNPDVVSHFNLLSFYFMIADYLGATYFPIIEHYSGQIELKLVSETKNQKL